MTKLWGGRFGKNTHQLVEDFHSSIGFDQRLFVQDILGSIAHARMLGDTGIITSSEATQIIAGLKKIREQIVAGEVELDPAAEDIHMNIEVLLTESIGPVGKKLHTGRSRNDQVAVDLCLYTKAQIVEIQALVKALLETLHLLAQGHIHTVMPGYTHLQRAQPVTLAHHLMAYFEMFYRDWQRLDDCNRRIQWSPLGAGALATTTFPIDRDQVAHELGFTGASANSIDAVSDRDYVIEFLSAASLIMMHLSRFCEELIFWASQEVAFVEMDDAYSTGSSIMPQKKNPDVAELIRGKTGRVYGHLMGMLTIMKGLPLAYNKDMQEDKEGLFDAVDTVKKCLLVFAPMLKTLTFNQERLAKAAKGGFTNATDLADYLVRKNLPFRDAHEVVGKMVAYCLTQAKNLEDLTLEEMQEFSRLIDNDVYEAIEILTCVEQRNVLGGPAPQQVQQALAHAEKRLSFL